MNMEACERTVDKCVHGYHIYKGIWDVASYWQGTPM